MNISWSLRIEGEIPPVEKFLAEWFDDKVYITAFTSGSTGKPKETHLLKSDMTRSAKATCEFFHIDDKSTMLCPLSTDYIAGKMMVVRAIVSGAKLIMKTPSSRFTEIIDDAIDLIPIVPTQVDGLVEWSSVDKIKNVIVGGGPIDSNRRKMLVKASCRSFATYGMTETCSHVALAEITEGELVYRALPGISFDMDVRECLIIKAPDFSFDGIATNDVVELIDDKRFKWKGRYDNVIISGGLKFFPEKIEKEIEPIIAKFKDITGYYVIGRPSERWGEEPILVIEAPVDFACGNLREDIEESLSDRRSMPKEIRIEKSFRRTGSGKVIRI